MNNEYFEVGEYKGKPYLVERILNDFDKPSRMWLVYEFIRAYIIVRRLPPTIKEIALYTKISASRVHYHLGELVELGLIYRLANKARSIVIRR
jgi:DNA-binding MarR family transcriptional regulator